MNSNYIAMSDDEVRACGIDPADPQASRKLVALLTGRPVEEFTVTAKTTIEPCPTCGGDATHVVGEGVDQWTCLPT